MSLRELFSRKQNNPKPAMDRRKTARYGLSGIAVRLYNDKLLIPKVSLSDLSAGGACLELAGEYDDSFSGELIISLVFPGHRPVQAVATFVSLDRSQGNSCLRVKWRIPDPEDFTVFLNGLVELALPSNERAA